MLPSKSSACSVENTKRFILLAISRLGDISLTEPLQRIELLYISGAFDDDGNVPKNVLRVEEILKMVINKYSLQFTSVDEALWWLSSKAKQQYERFSENVGDMNMLFEKHRRQIKTNLVALGFIAEFQPSRVKWDYMVILGATESRTKLELDFARLIIDRSTVIPKKIVVVSSERPLWAKPKNSKVYGEESAIELVIQKIEGQGKKGDTQQLRRDIEGMINAEFKSVNIEDKKAIENARANIISTVSQKYMVEWPTEHDMVTRVVGRAFSSVQISRITTFLTVPTLVYDASSNVESKLIHIIDHCCDALNGQSVVLLTSQPYAKYEHVVAKRVMRGASNIGIVAQPVVDASQLNLVVALQCFLKALSLYQQERQELLGQESEKSGTSLEDVKRCEELITGPAKV